MKRVVMATAAGLVLGGAAMSIGVHDASAKKSVQVECSAFEVPSVLPGQQKRDVYKTRVIPAGWTVVGGGVGPILKTDTYDAGAHVLACREHVPGTDAE